MQIITQANDKIFNIVNSFKYDNANKRNGSEYRHHIHGSVQERHNSIANARELCLSYINPLIYTLATWSWTALCYQIWQ